ncbi:MAG: carboxypeptidase regulatory-like domain-containing protein [Endozoicomonas sp.]|uniref:carboxypeptidase regulatory-like domain-containing protein n=1 Tax=Endozoicomonas sp. TaxID=1892382 RepID=UPI003D9B51AE
MLFRIVFATFLLILPLTHVSAVDLENASSWLREAANSDGGFYRSSDLALPWQSTSETVAALKDGLNQQEREQTNHFLSSGSDHSTEQLARWAATGLPSSENREKIQTVLASRQNNDGGFGAHSGYDSTVHDTAFALRGLNALGSRKGVLEAVAYLLNKRVEGSWRYTTGVDNDPILTAQVAIALWPLRKVYRDVQPALDDSAAYLLSLRSTDGSWATDMISAQSLLAITPLIEDPSSIENSRKVLADAQASNGSWGSDVYLTALALQALSLVPGAAANPDITSIRGTIVDAQTGIALSGVTLSLTGAETRNLVTDSLGHFSIERLIAGSYVLTIAQEGYQALEWRSSLTDGEQVSLGVLSLQQKTGSGVTTASIVGTVTSKPESTALSGVEVKVSMGSTEYEVRTNADGQFSLTGLPEGNASITLEKVGYQRREGTLVLKAGLNHVFSVSMEATKIPEARIQGTVTSAETSLPLDGVQIKVVGANNLELTSDANGTYTTATLQEGVVSVELSKEGYRSVRVSIDIKDGTTYSLSPALSKDGVPAVTSLKGAVKDALNEAPLTGVELELKTTSAVYKVQTESNGMFSFNGIETGDALLKFSKEEYVPIELNVTIVEETINNLGSLSLKKIVQPEKAVFSGRVLDVGTENPLAGAQVRIESGSDSRTYPISADGDFTISDVMPGQVLLTFTQAGYKDALYYFDATPGEVVTIGDVKLKKIETIPSLPDLGILGVSVSKLISDSQAGVVSGSLSIGVTNKGNVPARGSSEARVFYDVNKNDLYESEEDLLLGTIVLELDLLPEKSTTFEIEVSGQTPFRDAPLGIVINHERSVIESSYENNFVSTAGNCSRKGEVGVDLAFCLDSSGSIGYGGYKVQLNGIADAIQDSEIVPHDGSVRMTILTAGTGPRLHKILQPTRIISSTVEQLSAAIRSARYFGGDTDYMGYCVKQAADIVSAQEVESAFQVFTVAGDGVWPSDRGRYSVAEGLNAANESAVYASGKGIDVIDAIGVSTAWRNVLEAHVWPKPVGGDKGKLTLVNNSYEFAQLVGTSIKEQTSGIADLSVTKPEVIDRGGQLNVTFVIGNGGSIPVTQEFRVALYEGVDIEGKEPVAELIIDGLDKASYRELQFEKVAFKSGLQPEQLTVVVDSKNTLPECNEENNSVVLGLTPQSGAFEIALNNKSLLEGEQLGVKFTITNSGQLSGDYTAELKLIDKQGNLVQLFEPETVSLKSSDKVTGNRSWRVTGVTADVYRVEGVLLNKEEVILDKDMDSFSILVASESGQAAGSSIYADAEDYQPWDQVNLSARVANTSVNSAVESATARITIKNPAGEIIHQYEQPLTEIAVGGLRDIPVSFQLKGAVSGDYSVELEVRVSSDGRVLTRSEERFFVESSSAVLNLRGSVQATIRSLEAGTAQTCSFNIENRGKDIVNLPVRMGLVAARESDDSEFIQVFSFNPVIEANSSFQSRVSLETSGLLGEYACVLQAQTENEWKALAADAFLVTEPPVKLTGSLNKSDKGRLLALVDRPRQCKAVDSMTVAFDLKRHFTRLKSDVTVELLSDDGLVLDTEELRPYSRNWINDQWAETDLSGWVTKGRLLKVKLADSNGLDDHYQIRATYYTG